MSHHVDQIVEIPKFMTSTLALLFIDLISMDCFGYQAYSCTFVFFVYIALYKNNILKSIWMLYLHSLLHFIPIGIAGLPYMVLIPLTYTTKLLQHHLHLKVLAPVFCILSYPWILQTIVWLIQGSWNFKPAITQSVSNLILFLLCRYLFSWKEPKQ